MNKAEGFDYNDWLRSEELGEGIIHYAGDIDDHDAFWLRAQMAYALRYGAPDITIHMTSPGGGAYAALAVHDAIVEVAIDTPVTIIVSGYAASAASMIVLQAATHRVARPNSRLLVHEVRKFAFMEMSTSSDLEDEATEMKALTRQVAGIMAARSGKSVTEIEALFKRREVWFSASEALEYGLIDEVSAS
jgi:ATP-dependent Clp endopeptidase proteolytic subunit ClpP